MTRLLLLGLSLLALTGCQSPAPRAVQLEAPAEFGPVNARAQTQALDSALRRGDTAFVGQRLASCLDDPVGRYALQAQCAAFYSDLAVLDGAFRQALRDWLAEDPANYHARLLMGQVQRLAARAQLNRRNPRSTPNFYRQRAGALRALGREHLDAALALRPDLPYAYIAQIQLLADSGERGRLDALIERARLWTPTSLVVAEAALWAHQPGWRSSTGRLDALVEDYASRQADHPALARLPDYAELLRTWRARPHGSTHQDPDEALERLETLAERGYDEPRLYWALADVNARLGRTEAAREHILSAVAAAPSDAFILGSAACTCYGLSLEQVIELNERYVARYPTAFYAWRDLARDYLNRGDHQATLDAARRALALRPEDAEMRRYESGARAALGMATTDALAPTHYRGQVLHSLLTERTMVEVRASLRRQAAPQLTATQRRVFDRALADHLSGDRLERALSERLDHLNWDSETWRAVSTHMLDQAGIAENLDDGYRRRAQLRFRPGDDHAVAELERLYRQTVAALVQEFVYRQSRTLPLTSRGMTS